MKSATNIFHSIFEFVIYICYKQTKLWLTHIVSAAKKKYIRIGREVKTLKNIDNIYCHSLLVQYNTIQCYLSTECIQNQFFILFLKDCTSKHVGPIVS